jgi:hypothetical protein
VKYLPPDTLPPLSQGRIIEADIAAAFAQYSAPTPATLFD